MTAGGACCVSAEYVILGLPMKESASYRKQRGAERGQHAKEWFIANQIRNKYTGK